MSARENILQRLREVLDEELVEAETDLQQADAEDHEAELDLLELGAERDQLVVELELARAVIAEQRRQIEELQAEVQQRNEQQRDQESRRTPWHAHQDRSKPALDTPESAADFAEANAGRSKALFG